MNHGESQYVVMDNWYWIFMFKKESTLFKEVLQYQVNMWSGWSKPLFHLPVKKIYSIYGFKLTRQSKQSAWKQKCFALNIVVYIQVAKQEK